RHTLFFNLDHSIFDNMSGQVLRRQLLTRYRQLLAGNTAPMAPVKSFRDYLEQINRGPQGITKQKLLEIFELPRYQKAKNAVEERILARRQPQIRKLRYALDLDLYQISDDDDATWEITLMLLAYTLARFLEQDAVPLKIVYQGRQYQDLSYFDTLGLFIDVLPLLVMIDRDDPGALIEGLRRKIRFVNRYNVNFMNMLMNVAMRFKWWDALAPMNARKLGRRDPMILLNYVGKAEAEYQKVIDFSTRQMEGASSKDGYASLYVIVTRVDRTIQFDVFCNFERDIGVLQRLFEEEAARLFKRAARDSACET
ncbi:MAG: condensation domain-containing protein, partial [bacterium]